jgi:hypothetical protein
MILHSGWIALLALFLQLMHGVVGLIMGTVWRWEVQRLNIEASAFVIGFFNPQVMTFFFLYNQIGDQLDCLHHPLLHCKFSDFVLVHDILNVLTSVYKPVASLQTSSIIELVMHKFIVLHIRIKLSAYNIVIVVNLINLGVSSCLIFAKAFFKTSSRSLYLLTLAHEVYCSQYHEHTYTALLKNCQIIKNIWM